MKSSPSELVFITDKSENLENSMINGTWGAKLKILQILQKKAKNSAWIVPKALKIQIFFHFEFFTDFFD